MIDKFGRRLTYLRVSLIDRCNLRCLYCMPHGFLDPFKEEELLTMDEIAQVVGIFAELGISKVRLTGGEPLLRKGVPALVARLKATPGIHEVVMTTNGILLQAFAAKLKQAGLDRLNISLDTLDPENFKRIAAMDKLNEVLGGIDAALLNGLTPIKLNMVLMKGINDHEVPAMVRFAIERRMDLRFIEWMPTSAEIHSIREDKFLSTESVRQSLESEFCLLRKEVDPHAPARTYQIIGTDSTVGFISPLSNAFCSMCNRLRLKANGMMKTCLHGKEDLGLRELLRSGTSRKEIRRRIEETVFDRPKEHFLNDPTVQHNDFVMTAVGG